MNILFRYLVQEIAAATMLLLLALLALFGLFDLIRELGDLGKGSYGLMRVLTYVALSLPGHVMVIFPVAALLGTLFAVSRLSTQSELNVMRTSGLSLTKLAGLAAVIGLIFSIIVFVFGEVITPVADEAARKIRIAAVNTNVVGQQFRSGFWVKDDRSFVNILNVTTESELLDMRIFDFDREFRLQSITSARHAKFDRDRQWILSHVQKTTFEQGRARIEKLPEAVWNSAMTPDLISALRIQPQQMSLLNLYAYVGHQRDNKQNSTRYELAFWNKLLQPVSVVVMMLLGLPFAIRSTRLGGVGARLMIGIMIGIGGYFLNQLVAHLTVLNEWPPLLGAVAPLLVLFGVAAALLAQKEYAARWHRLVQRSGPLLTNP